MDRQPLISVCINCYNAEHTIAATVSSVLSQTYENLQVIVVDDCSADHTLSVLDTFDDPRLEVYSLTQNQHIAGANNEALRHVRGEYVAHLDADDVWMPQKLEKQLAFLEEHPRYGACFTLATMVDEHGNPVEDHRFRAENRDSRELFCFFVTHGNYLCHSSMLARKHVIDAVGEHDRSLLYYHDFDYWIRMSTLCEMYILPEELLYYRVSAAGNSYLVAEKENAHANEWARLVYNAVVACPDDFFLTAFSHRLRLSGAHTKTQTDLEKAFVLLDLFAHRPQNRAMGLRRLHELMKDPAYIETARRDFAFSIRDLYALNQSAVYHDESAVQAMKDTLLREKEEACDALRRECAVVRDELAAAHAHNAALTDELHAAVAAHHEAVLAHNAAAAQLRHIAASKSWKLTAPLRYAQVARRISRTARHPHTRDGREAKAVIVLCADFGRGDTNEPLLDALFRRYPDTVFVVYNTDNDVAFFDGYQNVYAFARQEPHAAKINEVGAKLRIDNAFKRLLLRYADAVVHVDDAANEQSQSPPRSARSRPFFAISAAADDTQAFAHLDTYIEHKKGTVVR